MTAKKKVEIPIAGWKVFNSDRTPPVQGGPAIWDGTFPFDLPKVNLDTSASDCGKKGGWHYCREMKDALRIGGFWKTGRPSLVVGVVAAPDAIDRGDKSRASTLRLVRLATPKELEAGVAAFSTVFGDHAAYMTAEQLAWRAALERPETSVKAVIAGLETALKARGLELELKRFDSTQAAWNAWDARDARAAWDAWDAWAALSLGFASRQGWVKYPADLLTVGIRDAYAHGLEIALPTGPNQLGWAMAEKKK